MEVLILTPKATKEQRKAMDKATFKQSNKPKSNRMPKPKRNYLKK